jgi:predicted PurR-regulated permease PerM
MNATHGESAGERAFHPWAMFAAAIGAVVVGLLLWLAAPTLLMLFAGVLLAVFLSGLTDLVRRYTRLPRGWALAAVCSALLAVSGIGGWLTAARLAEQAQQFVEEAPRAMKQLREKMQQHPWGKWAAAEVKDMRVTAEQRESALSQAADAASATVEGITGAVVILFLGLFLAVNPEIYQRGLVRLLPVDRRQRGQETLTRIGTALWRWILGRLVAMAAVGVCATVGFLLIGMPLALILGVFAGLMNFIPNLGPLIWLGPALLISLAQSPTAAAYVLVLYAIVQTAEGYLLTPLVQQRMIHLPPAITLSAQVLMGVLLGFGGLALATPLAAAALVTVQLLYIEDILGDPVSE